MSDLEYYFRRLISTILLIFVVATSIYFLFHLMPGSYTTTILGPGSTPEEVEQLREQWGLNDPIYVQYFHWLVNMISGNAGTSLQSQEPVVEVVGSAIRNSMILALPAIICSYIFGSIYGALMGMKPDSWFERYGPIPPTLVGTMPDFFMGILLLTVFTGWLGIFPYGGMASTGVMTNVSGLNVYLTLDFWYHYVLPFATVVLGSLYYPALVMRGSVVEVSNQAFTKYQRLLGMGKLMRIKNIMKHASLPVITSLPSSTSRAISGLILIEIIFNWPGVGQLLFTSILARDTPVIQFMFLLIAIWIIVGNLLVDITYTVIDPRVTLEQ